MSFSLVWDQHLGLCIFQGGFVPLVSCPHLGTQSSSLIDEVSVSGGRGLICGFLCWKGSLSWIL